MKVYHYDATQKPFELHGLVPGEGYTRLPRSLLPQLSPQVANLALKTSGARIRFSTSATHMTLCMHLADTAIKTHMTPLNMAGAEIWQGEGSSMRRAAVARPTASGSVPYEKLDGYALEQEVRCEAALSGRRETVTIYLPIFEGVEKVEIGLPEGEMPYPPAPYAVTPPIVFYGSSITQGACAGRPSLTYPAQVCRALDADFVNLGFAGNALGEQELARYIASLKMTAFVLDYDHNAPTPEHLQKTHQPFWKTIRKAQPQLPILIVSRPRNSSTDQTIRAYHRVIEQTYQAALASGDRLTAFLDGEAFFPQGREDDCLQDFIHPNDYGFHLMSERVLQALRPLLALRKE